MAACVDNSGSQSTTNPFSVKSLCTLIKCCKPRAANLVTRDSFDLYSHNSYKTSKVCPEDSTEDHIWLSIKEEVLLDIKQEPILFKYYCLSILSHCSLESALANHLAMKLGNTSFPSETFSKIIYSVLIEDIQIKKAIREDLKAVKERDPACISFVHCLLNFKGFLACQAHRIAHVLWSQGRTAMAFLIQNRVSEVFSVDIHPGAEIGHGILLDHATGVVIGETAVVGNNVTMLHNVTLGGRGNVDGDRHPKIGDGVLIGAGAKILGNVKIGKDAKIGAGSLVLQEVQPNSTVVGNPARLIGQRNCVD